MVMVIGPKRVVASDEDDGQKGSDEDYHSSVSSEFERFMLEIDPNGVVKSLGCLRLVVVVSSVFPVTSSRLRLTSKHAGV